MPSNFNNCEVSSILGRIQNIVRSVLILVGAFASCGVLSQAAHAGLIGDSVHTRALFPNANTTYEDGGTMTIANGTTFDLPIASLSAAFTDTRITITNTTPGDFISAPFNGLDFAFLSGATITSVIEDSASAAIFASGSVLSFAGNDIRLNLAGTCTACVGGEQIILDVTTASTAVPEPASTVLLAAGLLGVGVVRRRRRGTQSERHAFIAES